MELRNAKFLKNDLIKGRDQFQNIVSKKDHFDIQPSISSSKMIVIYNTPQVQIGVEQPTIKVQRAANDNQKISQAVDDNLVDPIIQELLENVEQPVEQHAPQENVDASLRRFTRTRKSTIPSDYIMYL